MNPSSSMQVLFQFAGLSPSLFAANSRYLGVTTATMTAPDGTVVTYLTRRFLPPPQSLTPMQTVTVTQGQRLDVIAAQYLGDPQLFWRICDANSATRPQDLTATPGRVLAIALPAGFPGGKVAP